MKQKTIEIKVTKDMTIGDVVQLYPSAIEVLTSEGVHCVGCGGAYQETIEQGLSTHGKTQEDIDNVVKRINESIVEEATNADSVIVTKKAAEKMKEIMIKEKKKGYGLRVDVVPGGCSGFKYNLDFEEKSKENDKVITSYGVDVFISSESISMMKGAKIDYVDSLQGAGFKITNPKAQSTCGCGDSFS